MNCYGRDLIVRDRFLSSFPSPTLHKRKLLTQVQWHCLECKPKARLYFEADQQQIRSTERLRSQNHEVFQTHPRLPERQKSSPVFHWKRPRVTPEVPEIHKRQCSPSRKGIIQYCFVLNSSWKMKCCHQDTSAGTFQQRTLGCIFIIAYKQASGLNVPSTCAVVPPEFQYVVPFNHI